MIVNKISGVVQTKINSVNVKKSLPVISSLGVLAGSSFSSVTPPKDVVHVSGSSVQDPFIDQFKHSGEQLLDLGADVGDAVGHGVSNMVDMFADTVSDFIDFLT